MTGALALDVALGPYFPPHRIAGGSPRKPVRIRRGPATVRDPDLSTTEDPERALTPPLELVSGKASDAASSQET